MKIAVTGGSGFIGQWLLKLYKNRHDFTLLGRRKAGNGFSIDETTFNYVNTDYSIGSLVELLNQMDGVIHLAAKRPSKAYHGDTFDVYMENIRISSNLFEACKIRDIANVVNMSSISVYSSDNKLLWKEEQRVSPMNLYGIGKVTVEKLAQYYNRNNMMIKSLRMAQVIGYGERKGFMFEKFIDKAFNKETLPIYGKGKGRREYIYVKDVAGAIIKAIEAENKRGIYNIGTGVNNSSPELAEIINEVFDNKGNLSFHPEKEEDETVFLMKGDKAKQELNWEAKWHLKAAVQDMKNSILSFEGNRN